VESTEIVGASETAKKGKGKVTERSTKRAKEEAGEEKPRPWPNGRWLWPSRTT
jgi:hypothetical protein